MRLPEKLQAKVDKMGPAARARADAEAALIGVSLAEFVLMRVRALRRPTLFGISYEDFVHIARVHGQR